ncbi:PREDICTED: spindle pole body component 110-like isoform X2 [Drosophila arizonae]|nr:PREDICTED: spindle pole body component 110-like isoform X2 [Drosophila arizonae]
MSSASTKENSCKNSKTSSKTGKGKMNRPIIIKGNSLKSDPTSSTNVLKCFVKHHKMSLEELKKKSNEISVKMEKTEIFIAERNQENAQLKRQLQDIREQLENVKAICDGLARENCELKDKYMACHSKYIELELSYDRELTILNANMIKQKGELEQVDRLNEQLKSENFQQRQVVAQLQAVSAEKDKQLTELKLKADQLQAYNVELKEVFEEYKENVSQKHERETAQLKEEVKEQAATIRELIENSEVRDVELQLAVSNMKHAEEFGTELSNRNSQLSSEVSDISHRLKVEIEDHNKKIRELNMQIMELVSETKRYQFDIAKLVEANNSLKDMNNEANAALANEVARVNQESSDLKKKFEQLQQEHMDTTKTLLAEKADLAEKLQALKELHASNIIALESEIQQKEELRLEFEQKVAELERQKN